MPIVGLHYRFSPGILLWAWKPDILLGSEEISELSSTYLMVVFNYRSLFELEVSSSDINAVLIGLAE